MAAVGGDAQGHRAVDSRGRRLAFHARRRDDAHLAHDLALLWIVGHVVHVGPVEGEGRIAVGEDLAHVFFQVFARMGIGQAIL